MTKREPDDALPGTEEERMNQDQMEGRWKELTGKLKERWGKLTDDEIAQAQGNKEELAGKIQQKYGESKEEIKRQLDDIAA